MNPFNAPINSPLLTCITPLLKDITPQVYKTKVTLVHRPYLSTGLGPHPVDIELVRLFDKEWFINRIQTFNTQMCGWQDIQHREVRELYQLWETNFLSYVEDGCLDEIQVKVRFPYVCRPVVVSPFLTQIIIH